LSLGFLAVAAAGILVHNQTMTLMGIGVMGLGLVGATFGVNALASIYFPAATRGTVIGLKFWNRARRSIRRAVFWRDSAFKAACRPPACSSWEPRP